jgi:peptide/nickel transport system permease protein
MLRDDSGKVIYEPLSLSLLDRICSSLREKTEKSYSKPLATRLFSKETTKTPEGRIIRDYPRLVYAGLHLSSEYEKTSDILHRVFVGLLIGIFVGLIVAGIIFTLMRNLNSAIFWGLITIGLVSILAIVIILAKSYHILGTDKVGNDVFYRGLKGVRTGLIIGGFTTILAIPFAIFFGVLAGYFGGRIDDIVQYIYTTLASIPGILLITAFMLLFGRGLFNLCLIMGITSWTGLCRLLRGETLKLRELEYVFAAKAFGAGHARIILRHIVPNIMHIVLIIFLLDFSSFVLTEALLSYLQIGVEPTRGSWGSMIDISRMELARDPFVWWNLSSAFIFMLVLVLSVNIFGDAVRDALDPRLRTK